MSNRLLSGMVLTWCFWIAVAFLLLPALVHAESTLRVGIYDFKPLVYQDEDGQASGIYVDLLNAISEEEDWTPEYVLCNWPQCLNMLEQGRLDLLTGILKSPERDEKFDFSQVSVLSTWGQLYAASGVQIENFRDLEGKSIAVVEKGYFYPKLRQYLEKFHVNARFVQVDSYQEVFRLTARGEVDACSAERVTGMGAERRFDITRTPLMYNPKEFLFAAPEGKGEILGAIDERLQKLKEGGEDSVYETTLQEHLYSGDGQPYVPKWLLWALAAAGLILLAAFILNVHFRRLVRKKTSQLRQREQDLKLTLDSIGDAVLTTDTSGIIQRMNPVAESLSGWEFEEAKGKHLSLVFSIIDAETGEQQSDPVQRLVHTGQIQTLPYQAVLVSRQGTQYHISDSASPIRDEQDAIVGVVIVFRDVTREHFSRKLTQLRLDLIEFSETHTMHELLTKCLDEVGRLVNSPIGFYHFVHQDQKHLTLQQWSTRTLRDNCGAEGSGKHYSIHEAGVWTDCVSERKTIVHNDYPSLPNRKGLPQGHVWVERELVVPIFREDHVVAIMGVGNKPEDYTERDRETVEYLADVTWEIAERKLAQERSLYLTRMLSAVRNVNKLITQEHDRDRLIQGACNSLVASRGYETAWIALLDEREELEDAVETGLGENFHLLRHMLARGEKPHCVRTALRGNGLMVTLDPTQDCAPCPIAELAPDTAKMCVRLEHNDTVYGVLTVALPAQFSTEEEEQDLLREVGDDLAFGLHNIRMEQQRRKEESERDITLRILHQLHSFDSVYQLISGVTRLLQEWSGCEAVGIRLREGEDFPYYETRGFSQEFVHAENSLCAMDSQGETVLDSQGKTILECMCGSVIRGSVDPDIPCFTPFGSFWTHSTTDLLDSISEEDKRFRYRIRGRCHREGYESVALIPLRHGNETLGLLQFNDSRRNHFDESQIRLFEHLAQNLALGLLQSRTAEALREREHLFRQLYERATMGILLVDAEHRIREANPRALSILGYTSEEIVQLSGYELVHPEDQDQLPLEATREKIEWGETVESESRFRRKDGSYIHVLTSLGSLIQVNSSASHMVLFQDITDRKRTEQILEARLRLMEYSLTHSFQEVLTFTVDEAESLTESRIGFYHFLQADQRTLSLQTWSTRTKTEACTARAPQEHYDLDQAGVWVDCIHKGEPVIHNDYSALPHRKGTPPGHPSIERQLVVPVYRGGAIKALLGVGNKPGSYTNADVETVSLLANLAWDITGQKQMEEKLREMSLYDSLTGLYNRNFFEEEMVRLDDERYSPMGIVVCDLDGLKFINDTLGHQAGDKMLVHTAELLRQNFRSSDIIARVGGDEFAVLLTQTPQDSVEKILQRLRQAVQDHNQAEPEMPLSLSLGHAVSDGGPPDLQSLFREADNRMYREKIQSDGSARNAILQGLTISMQARDFETEGHCDRLKELVASLGSTLELSQDYMNDLFLLARFHDLGKVGIPDHILFKAGPLTDEEWRQMRQHCEIGHRIAYSVPELKPIADYILKHHEWWNGEGYPFGLSGQDIPLLSRILAIADAYDAMTSDRPYRRAMSKEKALTELQSCSGTQFDPDLVEQFIEALKELQEE